ncbi:MAG: NYN domain-containing protein, partial [Hyphomicrobiaceae bacterium]|nr:NYN domain-containing protein [Hyphomicrobiaceae bacterium]
MKLNKNERTALFIDGANLYATTKTIGLEIDYKRLLKFFEAETHFIRALYYTAI